MISKTNSFYTKSLLFAGFLKQSLLIAPSFAKISFCKKVNDFSSLKGLVYLRKTFPVEKNIANIVVIFNRYLKNKVNCCTTSYIDDLAQNPP
jgi:hypothetical protein